MHILPLLCASRWCEMVAAAALLHPIANLLPRDSSRKLSLALLTTAVGLELDVVIDSTLEQGNLAVAFCQRDSQMYVRC
jgi:hypothetical protein